MRPLNRRATLSLLSTSAMSTKGAACAKFDAHLHVWASKEDADSGKFPFAQSGKLMGVGKGSEPPMPGHVECLLDEMESAGVLGALIIQPGNHLWDHSYVTSVLRRYGDKFAGAMLANPTTDDGVGEIERLITQEDYKAVRFNPYLWPPGEKMTNARGRAMYRKAGELGAPVGHMPFKGLLNHIDEIRALAEDSPDTKVMIDHFGFCKATGGVPDSLEWRALLSLAMLPQVYVKISAFFRVSQQAFPYEDMHAYVRSLIEAFGAHRLMWGSDYPWVTKECGYGRASEVPQKQWLMPEEQEWVFGKTLLTLFPTSFGQT